MRIHLRRSSVFLFLYVIILPQKAFIFLSSTKAVIGMLCKEVSMCKRVAITKNSFTCSFPLHHRLLSRVTEITSFSWNGHFHWQVHYTLYFQIVFPFWMFGRLIALAALTEKGLTNAVGLAEKTVITVFLCGWLRPLKGKILTFTFGSKVWAYIEIILAIYPSSVNLSERKNRSISSNVGLAYVIIILIKLEVVSLYALYSVI